MSNLMFPYSNMYAPRLTFGKIEQEYIDTYELPATCPLIGSFVTKQLDNGENGYVFEHDTSYDDDTDDNKTFNALYNILRDYWYTSDIGFDDSETFVKRFNAYWRMHKDRYFKLVKDYIAHATPLGSTEQENRDVTDKNTLNNGYTDSVHRETETTLDHDTTAESKNRQAYLQDDKGTLDGTDTFTADETYTRKRDGATDVRETKTTYNRTLNSLDDYVKYINELRIVDMWVDEFHKLFLEVL